MLEGKEIILGVTGSIAAYKAVEVLRELMKRGARVTCVMTASAQRFVAPLTFQTLSCQNVITDMFTLDYEAKIGHISTAERADLLLVAPATANIIGKFAHGIADDFLTNLFLATTVPVLIAPAMNTNMYEHPNVQANIKKLKGLGVRFVEPAYGELACGVEGRGRLAEVSDIVKAAEEVLAIRRDLEGRRVLVTAGPTQEPLDPVRFITNRSSGKMGYALAAAARDRGARVILVSGPTSLEPPSGVEFIPVITTEEMRRAVLERFEETDIVIKAAAVADYRPVKSAPSKIKKEEVTLKIELERNPDILAELGERKGRKVLVGFAAETEDLLKNAEEKLRKKNLDFIVANDVGKEGAGFSVETNLVKILDCKGNVEELPLLTKREVAEIVLDRVVAVLKERGPG
mgnify:CR=1 FL=1